MADYSKQYCKNEIMGFEGDFDIIEIANNLSPNSYTSIICEGYGFIAIGKNINNDIILAFPNYYNNTINWITYEDLINGKYNINN
jgi:hypothetical protein